MRYSFILLLIVVVISCSVVEYGPKNSKNDKGYWSKKIQRGVYRVYANYDNSSSPKRAMAYIAIRGYELCKKQNAPYVTLGRVTDDEKFEHSTRSANVYCRRGPQKFSIGAQLIDNTTRVVSLYKGGSKKLQPGDEILAVNGKRVTDRDELDVVLYNLRSAKRNIKVVVDRKGKKKSFYLKPILRKDAFSKEDVTAIANRWNVPLSKISGL